MRIAFIGPRGTGKSKISRKFSKITGKLMLSTDQLVCFEAGGKTIEEIVNLEGWISFRNREYELLKKLSKMDNIIIDCGGGILFDIDPDTNEEIESTRKINLLKENTILVFLKRELDWLTQKSHKNSQRPNLSEKNNYKEILLKRIPIYEKYANYILDLRNKEIEEGIEELQRVLSFG